VGVRGIVCVSKRVRRNGLSHTLTWYIADANGALVWDDTIAAAERLRVAIEVERWPRGELVSVDAAGHAQYRLAYRRGTKAERAEAARILAERGA
jgi:hypothetical protein